jgi:ABC-type multidrug transport system permease subunit
MLNGIKRFYSPPSDGQRSSRILATLFLLSAVSLGITERDFSSVLTFTALSFSFMYSGVWANDRINKVLLWLFLAALITSAIYRAFLNPS